MGGHEKKALQPDSLQLGGNRMFKVPPSRGLSRRVKDRACPLSSCNPAAGWFLPRQVPPSDLGRLMAVLRQAFPSFWRRLGLPSGVDTWGDHINSPSPELWYRIVSTSRSGWWHHRRLESRNPPAETQLQGMGEREASGDWLGPNASHATPHATLVHVCSWAVTSPVLGSRGSAWTNQGRARNDFACQEMLCLNEFFEKLGHLVNSQPQCRLLGSRGLFIFTFVETQHVGLSDSICHLPR
ncbi:hypothetical protein B0J18DRAFT_28937 [Chaetomium sp. MPI-SDFR-AT-0129]|nr:hypothetical protein B0J18DRAFT_28937 [Chaetomium sp. MPI-SDFR-AT-0129]